MDHPRHSKQIYGHDEATRMFENLLAAGKLHHAWLLCGPKGIGKASTAYKLAKLLLGGTADKLVENSTHPDMFVIESESEDDKIGSEIKVEEVRKLLNFLHTTPALAKRKVVIIDSIEMLNNNGANALLKALEEPALHTTFLLVCNSFKSLPATIRSRCAILKFKPLNLNDFEQALAAAGVKNDDIHSLYEISYGSVHMAAILAQPKHFELLEKIKQAVDASPQQGLSELLSIKKALANDEAWHCFTSVILRLMLTKIKQAALDGKDIDPLITWYQETEKLLQNQEIFNLDKENVALHIFSKG